jgi:hypothetical protein
VVASSGGGAGALDEARVRGQGDAGIRLFDRGAAAFGRGFERRDAHGRDDGRVRRHLDRQDRVARVDGTLERVRALDVHDVGDLADAEQRRHARHHVLAERRRRAEHVAVASSQLRNLRCVHRRQWLLVGRIFNDEYLPDARNGGRLSGHGRGIGGEDDHVHGAAWHPGSTRYGLRGADVQLRAVVLGDDEDPGAHQTNPFCFSAPTSSATSLTMMPLERAGGGSTLTVLNVLPSATPKSPRAFTSSGFFLAFMMSGSLT